MVHFQHGFYEESSKIKGFHGKILAHMRVKKWLIFVVFGHTSNINKNTSYKYPLEYMGAYRIPSIDILTYQLQFLVVLKNHIV